MENVYVCKAQDNSRDKNNLTLLAQHNNLEIMIQEVKENSFVWITPSEKEDAVEFFYILEGAITVEDENEKLNLKKGDCFYISDLKKELILKSEEGFKILYVSTVQTFHYLDEFSAHLDNVLKQIETKDNYTYSHCKRVMDYSIKIASEMKLDGISIDNITVASAFHDVGKCFIPDEVLQKSGKLTDEEFLHIMKHPTHSSKILRKKFGKAITTIVECHHERLDGSGYPFGKKGNEIPIEAQIIAVADSFDAMTTKRVYNNPKSFNTAIEELSSLTNLYNKKAVEALRDLINNNSLGRNDAI